MSDVYLTRRAAIDIQSIQEYSNNMWGERVAQKYITDLYAALSDAAAHPQRGVLRQHRSSPYLMVPAGKHFAVYEAIQSGIIIATIVHSYQDIETLIEQLTPALAQEVERIRANIGNTHHD